MTDFDFGPEYSLIHQITSKNLAPTERSKLVHQLAELPVDIYPYHHRWLLIHCVMPFQSWDDDGFHPDRSPWQREIQLLWATSYGKADIENGGLHQFFVNSTGNFAPELCEGFDLLGLQPTATIVRRAMEFFGPTYPRRQELREQVLWQIPGETRKEWDPFDTLTDDFYESLKPDSKFDDAADRFVRDRLGKRTLFDD
jgi:hypothetical protein